MRSVTSGLLVVFLLLSSGAQAGDWRFGAGINYVSGLSDVTDRFEKNYRNEYLVTEFDDLEIPIGLTFRTLFQADNGLRADFGVGPTAFIFVSCDGACEDRSYLDFPVSATIGYTFANSSSIAPYVRVGGVYHLAGGDYVDSSTPGIYAAAGVEFTRDRFIMWGFEVSIDTSEVDFEIIEPFSGTFQGRTESINTSDVVATVFMMF